MRPGPALALAFLAAAAPGGDRKPVVTVKPLVRVVLAPGRSAVARLAILVARGFHLQANPASQEYLVPTTLELARGSDIEPGKPIYPPGQPYRLQGASSDLSTYEGRFEIRLPLEASARAKPGERTLTGKLRYQACDAHSCLFPSSVTVELRVTVAPPGARSRSLSE